MTCENSGLYKWKKGSLMNERSNACRFHKEKQRMWFLLHFYRQDEIALEEPEGDRGRAVEGRLGKGCQCAVYSTWNTKGYKCDASQKGIISFQKGKKMASMIYSRRICYYSSNKSKHSTKIPHSAQVSNSFNRDLTSSWENIELSGAGLLVFYHFLAWILLCSECLTLQSKMQ